MNKKIMLLGLVALLITGLVVLSGCSASTSEPKETVTVTEQPDDTWNDYTGGDEDAFLDAVNTNGNWVIATTSDSDLLDLGWTICDSLDTGASPDEIIEVLIDTAETTDDAEAFATVMAGAVVHLCPEYYDIVAEAIQ